MALATAGPHQGHREPQASTLRTARVPHFHKRVEALLPPFLPVALSVEEQLVGARLQLARQQEPRTAAVGVSVAGVGGGRDDATSAWLSGSAHSAASDGPAAWLGMMLGPGAAEGPRCTLFLGNHRRRGRTMSNNHFTFGLIFSCISVIYKLQHKMDHISHNAL